MIKDMKAKPMLMSTPMVQALLGGRKTMTRRVVKFDKKLTKNFFEDKIASDSCPYGGIGDLLYVRETIRKSKNPLTDGWGVYVADDKGACDAWPWKNKSLPSIHMPKGLSRLTLVITGIRVERLQDISRGDAMAEGYPFPNIAKETDPRLWFKQLWQSIHSMESWDSNPWVWALEFEVIHKNINKVLNDTN